MYNNNLDNLSYIYEIHYLCSGKKKEHINGQNVNFFQHL